jgi:hypothetical protein
MSIIITFSSMLQFKEFSRKIAARTPSSSGRPGGTVSDLPTPDLVQICAELTKMGLPIPPLRMVRVCIVSGTESCSKR